MALVGFVLIIRLIEWLSSDLLHGMRDPCQPSYSICWIRCFTFFASIMFSLQVKTDLMYRRPANEDLQMAMAGSTVPKVSPFFSDVCKSHKGSICKSLDFKSTQTIAHGGDQYLLH